MQTIKMSGEMAELFMPSVELCVANPAEAVRALDANFPGFRRYAVDPDRAFAVIIDGESIGEEQLAHPVGKNQTIEFIPLVAGADSDFFQVILGAALIGLSFFLPTSPLIAGFEFSLSSIASSLGWSLLIGGVSQLLFGQPPPADPQERPDNVPSDYFNGPVNTTAEGQPVPIGYGRMIIGSHVVSAGFSVRDAEV